MQVKTRLLQKMTTAKILALTGLLLILYSCKTRNLNAEDLATSQVQYNGAKAPTPAIRPSTLQEPRWAQLPDIETKQIYDFLKTSNLVPKSYKPWAVHLKNVLCSRKQYVENYPQRPENLIADCRFWVDPTVLRYAPKNKFPDYVEFIYKSSDSKEFDSTRNIRIFKGSTTELPNIMDALGNSWNILQNAGRTLPTHAHSIVPPSTPQPDQIPTEYISANSVFIEVKKLSGGWQFTGYAEL